jgi:hypothetical protein
VSGQFGNVGSFEKDLVGIGCLHHVFIQIIKSGFMNRDYETASLFRGIRQVSGNRWLLPGISDLNVIGKAPLKL